MKIRLTKKIFYDVIIFMVGFGILIGIMFPFFIVIMGIPSELILNLRFFAYCVIAGIIVAIMNITIVEVIIIHRIHILSQHMKEVENTLNTGCIKKGYRYEPDSFLLREDSDDTLGECIKAFNKLIISLSHALKLRSDLHSFTSMLSKHMEINILSDKALNLLIEYLSAEGGLLLYKQNGQLLVTSFSGIMANQDIAKNSYILQAMNEGRAQIIEVQEECLCLKGMEFEYIPKNIIFQPITYEDMPIGVIILSRSILFCGEDMNKLDIFGMSLSMAMENAITHNQIQELATRDSLTGLYNRRFGMTSLNEEYSRSIREGHPLGLIMLDIDHFKAVNDYYGHLTGDKALIHVANILYETIRKGDILVRYGGEEFLCILPGADRNTSYEIAERARKKIEERTLDFDSQSIQMTISGGVSAYPETFVETAEILIREADTALYKAKKSGRNSISN